jgi:hypothetical protein
MEICLIAGATIVRLGVVALTLSWTHSVEKTRWEEDWRMSPAGLTVVESRIQGSGAGMEPPASARFDGKWYRWRPERGALPEVVLRRSGVAGDWTICREKLCQPMGELLPPNADPVVLTKCP